MYNWRAANGYPLTPQGLADLNQDIRNGLLKKLKDNDIPYKIDKKGNLEIREKDINKATLCCT